MLVLEMIFDAFHQRTSVMFDRPTTRANEMKLIVGVRELPADSSRPEPCFPGQAQGREQRQSSIDRGEIDTLVLLGNMAGDLLDRHVPIRPGQNVPDRPAGHR